jgi:CTP:molybdopterin cytidylyltransferase MocA
MLNPRYQMGRAGSLRIGAKAVNRDADLIIILNVDQPRPASLLARLLEVHDQASAATRPSFEGHTGHPAVVSGWLRPELLQATEEDAGLRGILRRHPTELATFEADAGCLLDLNTPGDYEEARRLMGVAG